jgi:hypothetical protein
LFLPDEGFHLEEIDFGGDFGVTEGGGSEWDELGEVFPRSFSVGTTTMSVRIWSEHLDVLTDECAFSDGREPRMP